MINRLPPPSKIASENHLPETEEVVCPVCQGAGFVHPLLEGSSKPDYSSVVPCQCRKEVVEQERNERYLRHCQLPAGSGQMTFENFKSDKDTKEAYESALNLANDKGLKWLTLLGQVDRGKTHLAIAICQRWLERGKPARYTYVPLLLDELRRGFDLEGEYAYRYKFDFFCNVPLLVLDDLGVQKPTVWAMEQLCTIIDYRYMNWLPLVVTMNCRLTEIPRDDEHRIASRLQRFQAGKVIAIEAKEYRLRRKI